jgi:hypothetical protein
MIDGLFTELNGSKSADQHSRDADKPDDLVVFVILKSDVTSKESATAQAKEADLPAPIGLGQTGG